MQYWYQLKADFVSNIYLNIAENSGILKDNMRLSDFYTKSVVNQESLSEFRIFESLFMFDIFFLTFCFVVLIVEVLYYIYRTFDNKNKLF